MDTTSHVLLYLLVRTALNPAHVQPLRSLPHQWNQPKRCLLKNLCTSFYHPPTLRIFLLKQWNLALCRAPVHSHYFPNRLHSVFINVGAGRREKSHCRHLGSVLQWVFVQRRTAANCIVHVTKPDQSNVCTVLCMGHSATFFAVCIC